MGLFDFTRGSEHSTHEVDIFGIKSGYRYRFTRFVHVGVRICAYVYVGGRLKGHLFVSAFLFTRLYLNCKFKPSFFVPDS